MARLSTHVLDTARGVPAEGVTIDLHRVEASGRLHIKRSSTNSDGRTGDSLVSGDRLETGIYELTFYAADYFRHAGIPVSNPPFFNEIVIRFGVSDPEGNYHVPLLLSPYSYTTYRGS